MKALLALALFAATCGAQTAKVIALDPADAAQAQALYAEQKAVEMKIANLQEKVAMKYLNASQATATCNLPWDGTKATNPCAYPEKWTQIDKTGWERGFEFSIDFKYIVPKQSTETVPVSNLCWTNESYKITGTMPTYGGLDWKKP